jgi:hypothetical protein
MRRIFGKKKERGSNRKKYGNVQLCFVFLTQNYEGNEMRWAMGRIRVE